MTFNALAMGKARKHLLPSLCVLSFLAFVEVEGRCAGHKIHFYESPRFASNPFKIWFMLQTRATDSKWPLGRYGFYMGPRECLQGRELSPRSEFNQVIRP